VPVEVSVSRSKPGTSMPTSSGTTTSAIAAELYLSVETVRWHVKAILRKLGVKSRAEAIACLEELRAV